MKKYIVMLVLTMMVALAVVYGISFLVYRYSKENALQMWQNTADMAAADVERYLEVPLNAVSFSAGTLNRMLAENSSSEEALDYLHRETDIYSNIIDENTTGVYAYFNGEYLDGSRWVPPEDYKPKERPWYTDALKGKGEIVLVRPFLNLQTNTMMMSVSCMLRDYDSVVSMDIFLDGVQRMMEDFGKSHSLRAALVMDKEGFVVAHSDAGEVGQTYTMDEKTLRADEVFLSPVTDEWNLLFILNTSVLLRPFRNILMVASLSLLAIMLVITLLFTSMYRKQKETEHLNKEIEAVAAIYVDMATVDFVADEMTIIKVSSGLKDFLPSKVMPFQKTILGGTDFLVAAQCRDLYRMFVRKEMLEALLSNAQTITHEFLDCHDKWMRLRFILVDKTAEGVPHHALMAFESIDEEIKLKESLIRKSEIDALTGIRNRGAGEALVRRYMAEGKSGVFLLLDADKFKSVNDTHGHSVGDKVIIGIASCLEKTFRESDVVFRLGGDEFAVFAAGLTDKTCATRVIDRLFRNVEAMDIPELPDRRVTVSIGAAFYLADRNVSFEALYERADSGTYESKKQAGNAVTFSPII